MFVLGNILFAVARVLDTLLTLYFWVVIISALLTWVRPDPYNPVVRTLNALTEPVLYRIRKWLPFTYISGLDLSCGSMEARYPPASRSATMALRAS